MSQLANKQNLFNDISILLKWNILASRLNRPRLNNTKRGYLNSQINKLNLACGF